MKTNGVNNIVPIIINPEDNQVFIEMDALFARSSLERNVRFSSDKAQVGNKPKLFWIVWVSIRMSKEGPYFAGCTACEILVSRDKRKGYKSLPVHLKMLDSSIKGSVILAHLDKKAKELLKEFLESYEKGIWERSNEELYRQLIDENRV